METDDHVILFLLDRKQIGAVEKLFAVGFGFFSLESMHFSVSFRILGILLMLFSSIQILPLYRLRW